MISLENEGWSRINSRFAQCVVEVASPTSFDLEALISVLWKSRVKHHILWIRRQVLSLEECWFWTFSCPGGMRNIYQWGNKLWRNSWALSTESMPFCSLFFNLTLFLFFASSISKTHFLLQCRVPTIVPVVPSLLGVVNWGKQCLFLLDFTMARRTLCCDMTFYFSGKNLARWQTNEYSKRETCRVLICTRMV